MVSNRRLSWALGLPYRLGYRRTLAASPATSKYSSRISARRLNELLENGEGRGAYLEIGVERGLTFEAVKSKRKVAVDPHPLFRETKLPEGASVFVGTSDEYFASVDSQTSFDLIFLDGLHLANQAYLDFVNSCGLSVTRTVIVIDDVFPSDEASALPDRGSSEEAKLREGISHSRWYGDVWKLLWLLLTRYPQLSIAVLEGDLERHVQVAVSCSQVLSSVKFNEEKDLRAMDECTYSGIVQSGELRRLLLERAGPARPISLN